MIIEKNRRAAHSIQGGSILGPSNRATSHKRASSIGPRRTSRVAALLVVVSVLIAAMGCASQKGAQETSASGVTTLNALGDFYNQLAADRLETTELNYMLSALDPNLPEPTKDVVTIREDDARSLAARGAMAKKLAVFYTSLGTLASSAPGAAAGTAAENLGTQIKDIPRLGTSIPFDPSPVMGMIAEDLVSIQHASDVRTASGLIAKVLDNVIILVESESGRPAGTDVYGLIINERASAAGNVARKLVQNGYVDPQTVLKQAADSVGLPWDGQLKGDAASATALKDAGGRILAAEIKRTDLLALGARDGLIDALKALAALHEKFAAGGQFDPAAATALADRAAAYITEIQTIRRQVRDAQRKAGAAPATKPSDG